MEKCKRKALWAVAKVWLVIAAIVGIFASFWGMLRYVDSRYGYTGMIYLMWLSIGLIIISGGLWMSIDVYADEKSKFAQKEDRNADSLDV